MTSSNRLSGAKSSKSDSCHATSGLGTFAAVRAARQADQDQRLVVLSQDFSQLFKPGTLSLQDCDPLGKHAQRIAYRYSYSYRAHVKGYNSLQITFLSSDLRRSQEP